MLFGVHVGFDHVPRLFCVEGKFQVLRRANSACSSGTQSTWRDVNLECFKLQVHLTGLVTQRCGSAWPAATLDPLLPEQVGLVNAWGTVPVFYEGNSFFNVATARGTTTTLDTS